MGEEGKKRILGRADILKVNDLSYETVDVPEWDGAVKIRTMTGKERHAFQGVVNKLKNPEEIVEYLIASAVVDEDGQPLFSFDDVRELGTRSAKALNRVFRAAARLNGMTKEAVEDAVGE